MTGFIGSRPGLCKDSQFQEGGVLIGPAALWCTDIQLIVSNRQDIRQNHFLNILSQFKCNFFKCCFFSLDMREDRRFANPICSDRRDLCALNSAGDAQELSNWCRGVRA